MVPGPQHYVHVAVEEFIGCGTQPRFEADHVIRVKKEIEIPAAAVKTADLRMTAEAEAFALLDADARQPFEVFSVQLFHSSTPSFSRISAMVIRIFCRIPRA
jgi:hypothetical protein